MPKSRIMIQLEPETIEQVDKIRGAVPRAAWVRLLIEDQLAFAERAKKYRADPELAKLTVAAVEEMNQADPQLANPDFPYQASVAQAELSVEEDAGSSPARRAGKGSPAANRSSQAADETGAPSATSVRNPAESPSRPTKKPKACKHTNQIRKLGAAFCTDCGEFV